MPGPARPPFTGTPTEGIAVPAAPPDRVVPDLGGGLWRATAPTPSPRPGPDGDTQADVVVVGAGVVGLTTAVLAAEAGLDVVVLEAAHVAHGTTGGTTGKFTSQNETRLAALHRRDGDEGVQRYTLANERGIAILDRLVDEHAIACDLERAPAHLVALHRSRADEVLAEAAASRIAGLHVETGEHVDELDLDAVTVLTIPDQRQCHPVRYCLGLADALEALGGRLHEHTPVTGVAHASNGGRRWAVSTATSRIVADHVVLATRLPIAQDRRLLFGRTMPMSAVGLAATIDTATPNGMYLLQDADRTWSIRGSRTTGAAGDDAGPDGTLEHLVAVGMSEETGARAALDGRGQALADWVGHRWPVVSFTHAWMAQDQMPADGRPHVGALTDGLWTTTGLGKWGLAMGGAAAEAMVEQLTGHDDRYGGYFSPDRVELASGWRSLLEAQLRVGGLLVGDRLGALPRHPDLAPGEGTVVRHGRTPVATCRTRDGQVHTVAATCTHLGCLVRWNRDAQTWDCGCHGSRFAPDGAVLEAPATRPLRHLDAQGAD